MIIDYTSNEILNAALDYAAMEISVVACYGIVGDGICTCGGRPNCKPGKHPIPKNGHLDASVDEAVIRQWWEEHPWANVGVVVGDGRWVFDIDPRNGGDETLAELVEKCGSIPLAPTVATGGGGLQFHFALPKNVTIKSRPIAQGIDAEGSGLVIAPPSRHTSGKRYEWVHGLDTPLADTPDWLLALACETPAKSPNGRVATVNGDGFVMGDAEPNDFATHPGVQSDPSNGKSRNKTLCRLVGVHLDRGDSPKTLLTLALAWAKRCDPPIPESRVRKVVGHAERRWRKTEDVDRGGGFGMSWTTTTSPTTSGRKELSRRR